MKIAGIWMMAGGVIVALLSLLMRTSVPNDPVLAAISNLPVASTLNLGLLQYQQLVFMAGLAIFVAGSVFVGAGEIVEAMRPASMNAASPAAPRAQPHPDAGTTIETSTAVDPMAIGADRDRAANMIAVVVIVLLVVSLAAFSLI